MAAPSVLPQKPNDGQVFIDFFGMVWIFDGSIQCWRRDSPLPDVPVADSENSGLLSPQGKTLLDSVADKGGGFGFITKPLLTLQSPDNQSGVVIGNIEFCSESLDIECFIPESTDGKNRGCEVPVEGTGEIVLRDGLDFSVSEIFFKSFCIQVKSAVGPKGEQGNTGEDGKLGTGDGPQGLKGDPGEDAGEFAEFTGVKLIDTDDVFDTAVISLDLDQVNSKLGVTRAKIKIPDDEGVANKMIADTIFRSFVFTDGLSGSLIMPPNDPIGEENVTILHYPVGFDVSNDQEVVVPSQSKLSDLVGEFLTFYQNELDKINEVFNKQCFNFLDDKDAEARTILADLGFELAQCEWDAPLEYCIGIGPDDCGFGKPEEHRFRTVDAGVGRGSLPIPVSVAGLDELLTELFGIGITGAGGT